MKVPGNRLKETIESNAPAVGATVLSGSPVLVEMLGDVGLDFVWVDLEHAGASPYDGAYLEHLTRAADAGDTELLIRVPRPEPAIVRKVLDTGVRNVLVPRVESAEEVRRAVEASRYAYDGGIGDRGLALSRANGWGLGLEGYLDREDESVLVGTMIENEKAIENLDEILGVPELGFAFIGPADLSVSVGRPLEMEGDEVQRRIRKVVQRCNDAEVPVAGIAPGRSRIPEMVDEGYEILVVDSDVEALQERTRTRLDDVDDAVDN